MQSKENRHVQICSMRIANRNEVGMCAIMIVWLCVSADQLQFFLLYRTNFLNKICKIGIVLLYSDGIVAINCTYAMNKCISIPIKCHQVNGHDAACTATAPLHTTHYLYRSGFYRILLWIAKQPSPCGSPVSRIVSNRPIYLTLSTSNDNQISSVCLKNAQVCTVHVHQ